MTSPRPRPALAVTATGVRPAADRLAPLTSLPALAPASGSLRDKAPKRGKRGSVGGAAKGAAKEDKDVELVVVLPRSVRKRLRAKAEALGYTPEEATYRLLRSWLDA